MNLFSPPKPPSPAKIADAQKSVARDTALLNASLGRIDQATPYGSLTYSQTGTDANGNPTFKATTALSPEQQAILNALQGNQQQIGGIAGNLLHNTADMYSTAPDFNSMVSDQTGDFLKRQLAFAQPYYTQQIDNLDAKLRNQGLFPGNPSYDRAMRELTQNQNQSVGTFINQAQPLLFNQAVTQYTTPLNAIASLMGLSRPAGLDLITPPGVSAPTPDITKSFMDQYNALAQQYANTWGAVGQFGAGLFGSPAGTSAATAAGAGLSNLLGLLA